MTVSNKAYVLKFKYVLHKITSEDYKKDPLYSSYKHSIFIFNLQANVIYQHGQRMIGFNILTENYIW